MPTPFSQEESKLRLLRGRRSSPESRILFEPTFQGIEEARSASRAQIETLSVFIVQLIFDLVADPPYRPIHLDPETKARIV